MPDDPKNLPHSPITDRLNRLFHRWRLSYPDEAAHAFSEDGIVAPELFDTAPVRVLFVLKDTHDFPGGDLRKFLWKGPKYPMWHTVARWALGALEGFQREYDDIPHEDHRALQTALRAIAAINLKKATGGASADMLEVNDYARRDRHFILDEIAIVDPDVIIGCGVREPLTWLFDLEVKQGPLAWAKGAGRTFIFTRHPARAENRSTFEALASTWRTCLT